MTQMPDNAPAVADKGGTAAPSTPVLDSAPPPLHSQALLASFVAYFFTSFPSFDEIDAVATKETFHHVLFPEYFSKETVGYIRLFFGCLALVDCAHATLYGE